MQPRRVLIKKWIPLQLVASEGGKMIPLSGTATFEEEFQTKGIFHQWGNAYEEFDNGAAPYTIAIVELEDGTVEEALPKNMKFLDTDLPFNYLFGKELNP